jgi:hypothetical protein
MTGLATFTVTDLPLDDAPPARQFRLSCPHGETTVTHLFGPAPDDSAVLALLRTRHEETERCGCAASLAGKAAEA